MSKAEKCDSKQEHHELQIFCLFSEEKSFSEIIRASFKDYLKRNLHKKDKKKSET